MQIITIDKGLRDANVEIENGEYAIIFSNNYLVFEIQNATDDDIVASIYKGKAVTDNGVRVIKKNESGALNHLMPNVNTVYISGAGMGRVYIAASNTEKNSFNVGGERSDGNSGNTGGGGMKLVDKIAPLVVQNSLSANVLIPKYNKEYLLQINYSFNQISSSDYKEGTRFYYIRTGNVPVAYKMNASPDAVVPFAGSMYGSDFNISAGVTRDRNMNVSIWIKATDSVSNKVTYSEAMLFDISNLK